MSHFTVTRKSAGRVKRTLHIGTFNTITEADALIAESKATDSPAIKPTYHLLMKRRSGTMLDDVVIEYIREKMRQSYPSSMQDEKFIDARATDYQKRVGLPKEEFFALVRQTEAKMGEDAHLLHMTAEEVGQQPVAILNNAQSTAQFRFTASEQELGCSRKPDSGR